MNNYLYERITNELNGLSDSDLFPSKVRNKLDYDLHLYSPRNDFVAVLVAYYEFMKNNISYEVLTNYCKETFSKFFNTEYISNNYEGIINDEKILNLVIELCSADAIKELFSHYLDDEKTYNMLKDLCEKYGKEVPVKSNKEEETQNSNESDETKKEYNEELDKVLDKSLDVNYFANDNMHFIDVDLCWAIRDDVEAAGIETLD